MRHLLTEGYALRFVKFMWTQEMSSDKLPEPSPVLTDYIFYTPPPCGDALALR
jgi:hypothetical protein